MALDALILQKGNSDVHSGLPLAIITGTGLSPRPRMRVDASQTSFWEGREFRVFHEFSLSAGASQWLRFVVPLDVVIHGRVLTVVQGNLRFALSAGGTPSGPWTPKVVQAVNSMSERPFYIGQVTSDVGGTVVAPVERDVLLLETGTSQASTVTQTVAESGLSAGTYYVELRNTGNGTLRGIYHVHWEERQPRSPIIY